MSCRETLERLDDYLDDALSTGGRRQVEEHLNRCDRCRKELASLGALLDTAQELSARRVEPGRDLWPGIERRLAGSPRPRPWHSRRWFGSPALLWRIAGAAAVLVVGLFLVQRAANVGPISGRETAGAPKGADAGAPLDEQLVSLDTEVNSVRRDVSAAAGGMDNAAVGSWEVFDSNLQVLDQAIRESRAALARDPENPVLQKSLLGAYQKQLELLRWASRILQQG